MTERRMRFHIDDVAIALIDLLLEHDGRFETDPGELIHSLAELLDFKYGAVRVAIRYLEDAGLVKVSRLTDDDPRQHNLLYRLEAL